MLLQSAMAAAARRGRIKICHFLWMANHLHILVVVQDAQECVHFYGELQKRLTDYVKRLLGLSHLDLWEGRPMIAPILDPQEVVERIAYYYLNPARANLVESIDDYPGFSSWEIFKQRRDSVSIETPIIRCSTIRRLPAHKIVASTDHAMAREYRDRSKETTCLEIEPNAWAACFHLDEVEIADAAEKVITLVREKQGEFSHSRKQENRRIVGTEPLRSQQIMKPHIPRKRERKIFVLSSIAELRIQFIKALDELCERCSELYARRMFHLWPPGMFRPPAPPLASALDW